MKSYVNGNELKNHGKETESSQLRQRIRPIWKLIQFIKNSMRIGNLCLLMVHYDNRFSCPFQANLLPKIPNYYTGFKSSLTVFNWPQFMQRKKHILKNLIAKNGVEWNPIHVQWITNHFLSLPGLLAYSIAQIWSHKFRTNISLTHKNSKILP